MQQYAGYSALIKIYDLPDLPRQVVSYIVSGARRTVDGQEFYPRIYAPENTLAGQLEFALKFEGVNLGVLAALFEVVPQPELTAYIKSKPTGINTRRAWFFYEFLTDRKLEIPDLSSSAGYVNALDPATYFTRPGVRLARYRVRDNLPGNKKFCPLVRKTPALRKHSWEELRNRAAAIINAHDAETLARTINYLYTKETRSSFAIEHEEVSRSKMERFGAALQSVRKFPVLDKPALLSLQAIMLEARTAATDYRTDQNYVGETLGNREIFHFIAPKPEDVPGLMQGLLEFLADSGALDPVVVAAIASFGFVLIHPFADGNGRTHRFMIHHILANRGVTPPEVIFPVSATMLNNAPAYNACLEAFSRTIMPLIEFMVHEDTSIAVTNDTLNLYRYFDATAMAEYLYNCIEVTIECELRNELETVSAFSQARKSLDAVFDLTEKDKNLFLKLCWQGRGEISKAKRKSHLSKFNDHDLDLMQKIVAPFFARDRT